MPTAILVALAAAAAAQVAGPPAAAPPAPSGAIPSGAAPAAVSPEMADERCLAVFAYLAGEPGQAAAQAPHYGTLFFYGKLMGRDPGADLGAGLRRAAADIMAGPLPSEITRCRSEMEAATHAMAAAGSAAQGAARAP